MKILERCTILFMGINSKIPRPIRIIIDITWAVVVIGGVAYCIYSYVA